MNKNFLLPVVLLLMSFVSYADYEVKVAYIDMEQVLSSRLVVDKIERLKSDFDKRTASFQETQDKLESQISSHEKEAASMTKAVREKKELELRQKAQRLAQQKNEMAQEFYTRQQEIRQEYLVQSANISKELAKAHDLQVVCPKQMLLYADESLDLTHELIVRLK